MKYLLALFIAAYTPWMVFSVVAFWKRMDHELELFRMGCHPRQKQLEHKIYGP